MLELVNRERWQRWVPIPIRMILGVGFMVHGWAKLSRGPAAFAELLKQAWLVTLLEIFGGLALLMGAFVTIVSVPLILLMLGAMFTVNIKYGFSAVNTIGLTSDGPQFGPPGYEINLLVHRRSGGADPGRCGSFVDRCIATAPTAAACASSRLTKTYLTARVNRRYADYSISAISRLRLLTSSLRKMAWRCFFTIGKLKRAPSAISWLLRPSQTSRATSCSRRVSRTRCGKRALAAGPLDGAA